MIGLALLGVIAAVVVDVQLIYTTFGGIVIITPIYYGPMQFHQQKWCGYSLQ